MSFGTEGEKFDARYKWQKIMLRGVRKLGIHEQ